VDFPGSSWTFREVCVAYGKSRYHQPVCCLGIDIGPLQYRVYGDNIYAFMDGIVSRVATSADNANKGYTVRIQHQNPLSNRYKKIDPVYAHDEQAACFCGTTHFCRHAAQLHRKIVEM